MAEAAELLNENLSVPVLGAVRGKGNVTACHAMAPADRFDNDFGRTFVSDKGALTDYLRGVGGHAIAGVRRLPRRDSRPIPETTHRLSASGWSAKCFCLDEFAKLAKVPAVIEGYRNKEALFWGIDPKKRLWNSTND